MRKTVSIPVFVCMRCWHDWLGRKFIKKGEQPVVCPRCKSPYWNREKVR